ncbi:hypothetical protein [Endozoicomonas ascidiicola]|uniref:hypothetical protein n=1 Tax=Endozoicomonas ascidiicola TaxID=1698521 RepID=UPI00082979FC|nr:hypothetical protein [Endozoicomonas ascidiicola]
METDLCAGVTKGNWHATACQLGISKQQTANSKQQTANSKQQTANSKQQTANDDFDAGIKEGINDNTLTPAAQRSLLISSAILDRNRTNKLVQPSVIRHTSPFILSGVEGSKHHTSTPLSANGMGINASLH